MSFNIRGFSRRADGINRWKNQAALNVATVRWHAPDLIGLQELQAVGQRPPARTRPPAPGGPA